MLSNKHTKHWDPGRRRWGHWTPGIRSVGPPSTDWPQCRPGHRTSARRRTDSQECLSFGSSWLSSLCSAAWSWSSRGGTATSETRGRPSCRRWARRGSWSSSVSPATRSSPRTCWACAFRTLSWPRRSASRSPLCRCCTFCWSSSAPGLRLFLTLCWTPSSLLNKAVFD